MMEFIKQHWVEILFALLALAEVIVRLTPTAKDNSIFNMVKKVIDYLFANRKRLGGRH